MIGDIFKWGRGEGGGATATLTYSKGEKYEGFD